MPIVYALICGTPMSSPKMTRMLGRCPAGWAGAGAGCSCAWAVRLGASAEAAASVVPPSRMLRRLMARSSASALRLSRAACGAHLVSSVIVFSFGRSRPSWKHVVHQRGLPQEHLADHVAGLDVVGEDGDARRAAGGQALGNRLVVEADADDEGRRLHLRRRHGRAGDLGLTGGHRLNHSLDAARENLARKQLEPRPRRPAPPAVNGAN